MHKTNHTIIKNIFRILCFIVVVCFLLNTIIGIFTSYVVPNYISLILHIFVYLFCIPIAIIGIDNIFDRILNFMFVVSSLLIASIVFSEIINIIFKNEYIFQYFVITMFFVFSYLYEIQFNNIDNFSFLFYTEGFKQYSKVWGYSSSIIGYTCNIVRIILLIFSIFDKQYNLCPALSNLPISEAILTALAFEKIMKIKVKIKK